uniref:Ribosomal protein L16 n=1 Tax=Rhizaria sp. TaxID=2204297 RepID=A0A5P8DJS7_9EUKA|nr:ribosomal protein L16 [Rhizaria sp.]
MKINKYKKYHKIKNIFKNERNSLTVIKKGFYGFKILESGIITPKQLETARRIIARITKRSGKIFINIFCNHALTKKPLLSRMGKGSGGVSLWISYVKKGKIFIELKGISKKVAYIAFKAVSKRISLKMKFLERNIMDA